MDIQYYTLDSTLDYDVLNGIIDLHKTIFETADGLNEKINNEDKVLIVVAINNMKVIGYKIGYQLNDDTFYSWLGGVDINFRKYGIASKLMEKQHQYLIKAGYSVVQTKTMNKWRNMLLLNIKYGFDVIHTYTDEKGLHKIVLEKKLLY
ncbi:GNAT family N-acetyltransferase [Planococcus halocryophilus]|uniref:GNAT family N-acetyltransferase n=1 Tax=Planococcus halocryophilus TaxID=1215089 RepID=UPI001F0EC6E7|nr:GNAT family N-acetyltransferase [Planococcus halocryophilus]